MINPHEASTNMPETDQKSAKQLIFSASSFIVLSLQHWDDLLSLARLDKSYEKNAEL